MNTNRKYAESLLWKAELEIKGGYPKNGRRYLQDAEVVTHDADLRAKIYYLYAKISTERAEKLRWLKETLAYAPTHPEARRELAILEGRLQPEDIIDPNTVAAFSADEKEVSADRFTCPQCGARMVYAPDGHTLYCEHCSARRHLDARAVTAAEQDFFAGLATRRGHRQPQATQIFRCQGCGAEFLLSPQTISATCAWCNSPHVVALDERRDVIPPDGIIPHNFDLQKILRYVAIWAQEQKRQPDRPLAPPRGLYLPIWTFDTIGSISYRGEIEQRNTSYRSFAYTKPQNEKFSGEHPLHYDDLPIPASERLKDLFASLLPTYNLRATQPYKPDFLADWSAEIYNIPLAEASLEARNKAYTLTKDDLRPYLPPNTINLQTSSENLQISTYKLVLLPLWHTQWQQAGKVYTLLINGQNGRIVSDLDDKRLPWKNWLDDIFSA